MIKRFVPFVIVAMMFVLTSCGTASPRSSYATTMDPAIAQLAKWQTQYENFETLLMDPNATPNGLSRLEMIELYNMATEYEITREDYVNLGFMPLDILIGDANKFARDGHGIEDALLAVTPDEEIQVTHQAVLACIQNRVAFAEEVASSIKNLESVDLSGDVSICGSFDENLAKLNSYVKEHQ